MGTIVYNIDFGIYRIKKSYAENLSKLYIKCV